MNEEPELKFGRLPERNELMERGIEYNLDRYVLELDAEVKRLRKEASLLEYSADMLRYMKWKVRSLQDRLDIVTKAKDGMD